MNMLADLLVDRYGIDRETAEKDAAAVAGQWQETGLAK